jgi:hypothetical protein
MSVFKSEKLINIVVDDLAPVVEELSQHFRDREYEVAHVQTQPQGWEVAVTKGGVFKAVVGLKTALKIQVVGQDTGTSVKAGVGIFGRQAVPTAISMLVFWPVLLTQVWGLIKQAGLDDEAVKVVEVSLSRRSRLAGHTGHTSPSGRDAGLTAPGPVPSTGQTSFCTNCGQQLPPEGAFCSGCGQRRPIQNSPA